MEALQVVLGPPVVEASLGVELRALVVEAVADLVADDDADGAVVHGVGGVEVERRRLQDSGGEDDLVEERVVVGVRGRRRHAPAAAVDRLADLHAVVDRERTSLRRSTLAK